MVIMRHEGDREMELIKIHPDTKSEIIKAIEYQIRLSKDENDLEEVVNLEKLNQLIEFITD